MAISACQLVAAQHSLVTTCRSYSSISADILSKLLVWSTLRRKNGSSTTWVVSRRSDLMDEGGNEMKSINIRSQNDERRDR